MTANAAKPTTAALREEDAGRFGAEAYDDRWSLESGAGGADDEEVATNAAKPTSLHLARQAGLMPHLKGETLAPWQICLFQFSRNGVTRRRTYRGIRPT